MRTDSVGPPRTDTYAAASGMKNTNRAASPSAGTRSSRRVSGGADTDSDRADFTDKHEPFAEAEPANNDEAVAGTEQLEATIQAFVAHCNLLMDILHLDSDEHSRRISEALREAVYRPVALSYTRRISLYEAGVAHAPNKDSGAFEGRLTVNGDKLRAACAHRREDVCVLFTQPDDGLFTRLDQLLRTFAEQTISEAARTSCESFLQFLTQSIFFK